MMKRLSCIVLCITSAVFAQWSNDPDTNSWIPKPGRQTRPLGATDGDAGMIVVWDEGGGLWANRVDKHGRFRWGLDGVRVSPIGGIRDVTNVISDGRGGAMIVWDDLTKSWLENPGARRFDTEIYAQRIDSAGTVIWDTAGVAIRSRIRDTQAGAFNLITSDHDSYIVVWTDNRNPTPTNPRDFYAQRIELAGDLLWQENGIRLNEENTVHNTRHRVLSDGDNGFLLVWFNPDPMVGQDVIVDRFDKDGNRVWLQGHVHANTGGAFQATTDGLGGVIVVGAYIRGVGINKALDGRIQRIDRNGRLCWSDSAVVFLRDRTQHLGFLITPTIDSGALVSWSEDVPFDLHPKRHFLAFDSSGSVKWQNTDFRFGHSSITHPLTFSDGHFGMILLINDYEKNRETGESHQVALRVDANGNAVWSKEGVLFRHRSFNDWPFLLEGVPDGQGGIIALWTDGHQGSGADVTMQLISAAGILGEVSTAVSTAPQPAKFIVHQNYPNPFNASTTLAFYLSQRDEVYAAIHDLHGRQLKVLIDQTLEAGIHRTVWDGTDELNRPVSSGIYLVRIRAGAFSAQRKLVLIK